MERFDDTSRLVVGLNDAQKQAVTAAPDHRLILAGAGSGKTRVLVHRIAWLLSVERISPLSVLAVTFTNKAAGEMRSRIEELISTPVRSMWVGTFHGLAHRMLRLHWKDAGLNHDFQILDSDDQQRLLRRIIKGLELPEDQWQARAVAAWINRQKEEARRPEAIATGNDYSLLQMANIYAAYERACNQAGLVDFAELLLRAFELTRDHPDLMDHYRRRFRHILIDEFQDTNSLQYMWIRSLAGDKGILFAVGDDDQSIYSWRGARVENMLNLRQDFPSVETIRLEQNYRSTAQILRAANALISHNTQRLGKELWTDSVEGEPIQLYGAFNEYDEADYVISRIRDQLNGPIKASDISVLYRSNAQSRVLEEALVRARIPYRIYGGQRFFERQEIKDAIAYLRLIKNSDDDPSFERVVNLPPRGIGATTTDKIRTLSRQKGQSMWEASRESVQSLGRSAAKVSAFQELIESLRAKIVELTLSESIKTIIQAAALKEHYSKERGEKAEARLENLEELINAARAFEDHRDSNPAEADGIDGTLPVMDPISDFLAHAVLESGEGQAAPGEDCVQLMTLHSAKGLEFPMVFIVGVENGLFPSARAIDEGNLEEERRLFYVGLTRAQRSACLSYAEIRRVHGTEQLGSPSSFLKELPSDSLMEIRPRAAVLRPAFGAGRDRGGVSRPRLAGVTRGTRTPNASLSETVSGNYKLGMQVSHPKFGNGTILSFDGSGDRTQVEIRFDQAGTKRLMLSFAKLDPV